MSGNLRVKAHNLRSQGWSLDQITKELQKPKSTVYYWISHLPPTEKLKRRWKRKRQVAQRKAIKVVRVKRLNRIKELELQGIKDISQVSDRDLFIFGIALYWAEGSKQNSKNISQGLTFTNKDPKMICVYLRWLDLIRVPEIDRQYSLYIHKQYKTVEIEIKHTWEDLLGNRVKVWGKTVLKQHESNMEITKDYLGLIRVTIKRSSDLNRRVSGWINAVYSLI